MAVQARDAGGLDGGDKGNAERDTFGVGRRDIAEGLDAEVNYARRDKKAFFSDQCKEIEGNNRMGKTRDLFKKIRDTKVPGFSVHGILQARILEWVTISFSRAPRD